MRQIVEPGEVFEFTFAMTTRDRQWHQYLWSDRALYMKTGDERDYLGPIVRLPLPAIQAVQYGYPPSGTYHFLEVASPIMVIDLKGQANVTVTKGGDSQARSTTLSEVPVLAISNDSAIEDLFGFLRQHRVNVVNHHSATRSP